MARPIMTRRSSPLAVCGWLLTLRLAAIGTAAGDVASTAASLQHGGRELNPLLAPAPIARAAAIDTGVLTGIAALERRHPTLAKVLYVTMIASRGVAVAHNVRGRR